MVSMVPFSYSRAITSEVSRAPTIMMMTAMMPGTMKLRLSRSSLNQTRMRPSTGGRIRSRPWRFRKSSELAFVRLGDEGRDEGPGVAGGVGVAAVDHDLQRALAVGLEIGAPAGRDDDAEDDPVVVEQVREHGGGGRMGDDVEIDRGIQPADEIAAFRGPVVVDHRGGDVLHVQAERIAEKQDQEQRNDEGQVEAAEVPDEVVVLLAGDGPDLAERS